MSAVDLRLVPLSSLKKKKAGKITLPSVIYQIVAPIAAKTSFFFEEHWIPSRE